METKAMETTMLEIGKREEAIKDGVLAAMQVGKLAALEAAAAQQQLGKDAQVVAQIVKTIWRAIEDGDLASYAFDALESMRRRGEY